MQMLIMRRVDHAFLAEPATSIALRKTGSFPLKLVAPDLYRTNMIKDEWGETFKVEAKIPVAGMAVVGDNIKNKYLIFDDYRVKCAIGKRGIKIKIILSESTNEQTRKSISILSNYFKKDNKKKIRNKNC